MTIEKLNFAGYEVIINSEFLRFDENTLGRYIQDESGYFDNFGASLALAERNLQNKEMYHERIYSERFVEAKENGSTEKLAEAKSKADSDVVSAKQDVIEARYAVNRLKQHLKAWDKSHDNAQSMGHMLRKTMDKLNAEIMAGFYQRGSQGIAGLDQAIERTVIPFEISVADDPQENSVAEFETNLSIDNLF